MKMKTIHRNPKKRLPFRIFPQSRDLTRSVWNGQVIRTSLIKFLVTWEGGARLRLRQTSEEAALLGHGHGPRSLRLHRHLCHHLAGSRENDCFPWLAPNAPCILRPVVSNNAGNLVEPLEVGVGLEGRDLRDGGDHLQALGHRANDNTGVVQHWRRAWTGGDGKLKVGNVLGLGREFGLWVLEVEADRSRPRVAQGKGLGGNKVAVVSPYARRHLHLAILARAGLSSKDVLHREERDVRERWGESQVMVQGEVCRWRGGRNEGTMDSL